MATDESAGSVAELWRFPVKSMGGGALFPCAGGHAVPVAMGTLRAGDLVAVV